MVNPSPCLEQLALTQWRCGWIPPGKQEWTIKNGNDSGCHCHYCSNLFVCLLQDWLYIHCCWQYYFHHRNAMSIGQLMKEAYHIMDSTPADIHPQNVLEDFTPLTQGQYPIFNKYPKFIVDYQVCMLIVIRVWLLTRRVYKTDRPHEKGRMVDVVLSYRCRV